MTPKDQTPSKAAKFNSPAEPSGTFHGSSSHPFLQALISSPPNCALQRDFLFRARTNTHVGLGAFSRAPTPNKNLLLRPLVTTHLPFITHRAPPAQRGARPCGFKPTRMLSDRDLVEESSNSPRKKAKRSKDNRSSLEGSTFVVIDNVGFDPISYPTSAFMSCCFTCEKKLMPNEDIYILRGEMAFCSCECREREIFNQEKREKMDAASSSVSRMITRNRTLRSLSELSHPH